MNSTQYYNDVYKDYCELNEIYPFCKVEFPPIETFGEVIITVLAANIDLVKETMANESDFLGTYSKKLTVIVPKNYQQNGCFVYGGQWIDAMVIPDKDRHWFMWDDKFNAFKLCVGIPSSYKYLSNVILENVRTAENMLIAYENYMKGTTNNLQLLAYDHGIAGIKQYEAQKHKYTTLGNRK